MATVADLPPNHARLVQEFEAEVTAASAQVALRFCHLKKELKKTSFTLSNFLTPDTRRTVAIATATFGNASAALERLYASTDDPPSWPDAAKAIIGARDQRRSGRSGLKGVSATREVTPKDVQEAATLLKVTMPTNSAHASPTPPTREPLDKPGASRAAPPRTREPSASPEIPRHATVDPSILAEKPVSELPYNLLSDTTAYASRSQLDEERLDPLNFDDDDNQDDEDGFDDNTFSDLKLAPHSPRFASRLLPLNPSFCDDSLTPLSTPLQHSASYSQRPRLAPSSSLNLAIPLALPGREAAPALPLAPENMEPLVSQEALQRLQDRCKLNDEAIYTILQKVTPSTFRVIEICLPPSGQWGDWARVERHYNLDFGTTDVLIPLCTSRLQHWSLLHLNLHNRNACLYDSHQPSLRRDEAQDIALAIVKAVGQNWDAQNWCLKIMDTPQQTDDIECGTFLLVTALHIIADISLPKQLDPRLWRQMLRSAASGKPKDAAGCVEGVHWKQAFDDVADKLKYVSEQKAGVCNARCVVAITNIRVLADSVSMNERVDAFSRARKMAADLFQVIEPYPSQHKDAYSRLPILLEENVALSTKKYEELQGRKAFLTVLLQATDLLHTRLNELIEQINATISRSN